MEQLKNILAIIGSISVLWMLYTLIFRIKLIQNYALASITKIDISLFELLLMGFRKTDTTIMVTSLIALKESGISVNKLELEAHYLAGGNLKNLVNGLIYAKKENLEIEIGKAMRLELKNKNLPETFRLWKLTNPDKTIIDKQ